MRASVLLPRVTPRHAGRLSIIERSCAMRFRKLAPCRRHRAMRRTAFIIFCICTNCFSRRLTSSTWSAAGADPLAARAVVRCGAAVAGRHRVDDRLDARHLASRRPPSAHLLQVAHARDHAQQVLERGPSCGWCELLVRKSSSVNWLFRIFSSSFWASSTSDAPARLLESATARRPVPSMRETMRRVNGSRSAGARRCPQTQWARRRRRRPTGRRARARPPSIW